MYFEDCIIYRKPHTQSLHPVLLLHSKTSILLLPDETVPADPLPAPHISRAPMPLRCGRYQQVMAFTHLQQHLKPERTLHQTDSASVKSMAKQAGEHNREGKKIILTSSLKGRNVSDSRRFVSREL